jgi:tripartite-type tricarboxylate transporter receptor subunit TctC
MQNPIGRAGLAGLALAACAAAFAQNYPAKAVRFVVPSAPGGSFDLLTRAFGQQVSAGLGQPAIVDNRPASGGNLALELVAKAAPDGYTVLTAGNSQLVFNKFFRVSLPYDAQKDFAPLTFIAKIPFAMYVHPSLPVSSLKELIAYARAQPNRLNYGSAGIGHSFHLVTELLSQRTGIQMVHVPYKGAAPGLQDLVAGRIQVMFYSPTGPVIGLVKEGKIRPIAALSDKRFEGLPDVPTFHEAGVPNLNVAPWMSMLAPAGTPREIIARLHNEIVRAAQAPELARVYQANSLVPYTSEPQLVSQTIGRELELWGPIIQSLGIKPE